MNIEKSIPALVILGIYILAHVIIVAALLRARRRLPANLGASAPRWLLVSTALPLIGPVLSCFGFAKLARAYQRATTSNPMLRSDCGLLAGIAYGLTYLAAGWAGSAGLGFLCLCFLILFFVQLRSAGRALASAPPLAAGA